MFLLKCTVIYNTATLIPLANTSMPDLQKSIIQNRVLQPFAFLYAGSLEIRTYA